MKEEHMAPSKLYNRNYNSLTREEMKIRDEYLESKKITNLCQSMSIDELPLSVRHNLSLFPNNHIELFGMKNECDLHDLNEKFYALINSPECLERDILNFINQTPAYHIVGSILMDRFPFGHHELYLFKEMKLGDDYRTDYVLIGKGSGDYEFVLIEFERPGGRITTNDGHWGQAFRAGTYQLNDWEMWMNRNHSVFFKDLSSVMRDDNVPKAFIDYDASRFHYVVVAGRRDDFSENTYYERRVDNRVIHLHYDNLYDNSVKLEQRSTF